VKLGQVRINRVGDLARFVASWYRGDIEVIQLPRYMVSRWEKPLLFIHPVTLSGININDYYAALTEARDVMNLLDQRTNCSINVPKLLEIEERYAIKR
jgi:hypothetical protein